MRIFKTRWFSKQARKSNIGDAELCKAVVDLVQGKGVDLGGGVYKKRLNENRHRGILLVKTNDFWVYQYIFEKSDRANIDTSELEDFRRLAKGYAAMSDKMLAQLIEAEDLLEISNEF